MLGYLSRLRLKTVLIVLIPCILMYLYLAKISTPSDDSAPIILWWTSFMFENERPINCPQRNCLLTKDKRYINNSNLKAIMFYGSRFELDNLPLPKQDKIWAIFHEESPRNVALFLGNRTFDQFEIVSTFSRFSDFPVTLQYLEHLSLLTDINYFVDLATKNNLLESLAPILYLQSDCDTPNERDNYVKELMKYIEVDSYGLCLHNRDLPPEISNLYKLDLYNELLLEFVGKYKFIIAIENAICDDYITEKLWRPLITGTVPIYLGSPTIEVSMAALAMYYPNYVQDWLPNPLSAILIRDFASPKELADYITTINENDELYEDYLEHKRGKIRNKRLKAEMSKGPYGLNLDHPITAFECFVCDNILTRGRKIREQSVYNCDKPTKDSSWGRHWELGKCQSEVFAELVEHQVSNLQCNL